MYTIKVLLSLYEFNHTKITKFIPNVNNDTKQTECLPGVTSRFLSPSFFLNVSGPFTVEGNGGDSKSKAYHWIPRHEEPTNYMELKAKLAF